MTFEEIVTYMTSNGWPVETVGTHSFRTRFANSGRTFLMLAQVDTGYLVLLVIPLTRLPTDEAVAEQLMELLLELNEQILFAKFSVDEDADVVLSLEFPAIDMSQSQLQEALDVLTFYAGEYGPRIAKMADTAAMSA